MKHAFAFLLLLASATVPPKPLNGCGEIVVEVLTVEKSCSRLSPAESDLLQKSIVGRLRARKLATIIDCATTDGAAAAKLAAAPDVRRLIVTVAVLDFSRGSRAARALGMGAGATRLRVRFTFKDPASGKDVLTAERIGRYTGRFSGDGGTSEAAFSTAVLEVADGLADVVEKNR